MSASFRRDPAWKSYISGDDDEYSFERLSLHEEDVPRFVVLDEHDRVEFLRRLHRHGSQGSTRTPRLELAFARFKRGMCKFQPCSNAICSAVLAIAQSAFLMSQISGSVQSLPFCGSRDMGESASFDQNSTEGRRALKSSVSDSTVATMMTPEMINSAFILIQLRFVQGPIGLRNSGLAAETVAGWILSANVLRGSGRISITMHDVCQTSMAWEFAKSRQLRILPEYPIEKCCRQYGTAPMAAFG